MLMLLLKRKRVRRRVAVEKSLLLQKLKKLRKMKPLHGKVENLISS